MPATVDPFVFSSDRFPLPLPAGHRFPVEKYRLLRERIERGDAGEPIQVGEPPAANDPQLLRVHTPEYLDKLARGGLSPSEQRQIGFPWSAAIVERSRRSTGATIAAARAAHASQLGIHLAGGTHHAFSDRGQGFCVFNDVAVAIRELQADSAVRRALVIDLDVHQGNGTAHIFADDPRVFTFSLHGERNFPFDKDGSDLDIGMPDGSRDEPILSALDEVLSTRLPWASADVCFFLAGADPFEDDRFGRLKMTKAGLARRDEMVVSAAFAAGVPLVVVMAGGYARNVEDVVSIHVATVRIALQRARAGAI